MATAATRPFQKEALILVGVALAAWALPAHAAAPTGAQTRAVQDGLGEIVQVALRPSRIITLVPSLAELASDLLGNDLERIIGVSEYTRYPLSLAKRPSIGPYFRPNLESILALKPDLVLATVDGNPKETILRLRELGMPVLVVRTGTMEEILASMRILGEALDRSSAAAQMIAKLQAGVAVIKDRSSKRTTKRRLLIQLQEDPVIVAGGKSFLGEMAKLIGAELLYADASQPYPVVSLEDIVSKKPEALVIISMDRLDDPRVVAIGRRWKTFKAVPAVVNGRIRILSGDRVTRPTLKLIEGLALLEKAVYGS